MSLKFQNIQEQLQNEISVLNSLIYRSKNQHKSSIILRKMIHLKRLLRITNLKRTDKIKITNCAKNLYLAASADLSMGFFIPLCLCLLGISARIFYLIDRCEVIDNRSMIDDIFS